MGGVATASEDREFALLRFLAELESDLDGVRRTDKAFKLTLRRLCELFGAQAACIGVLRPGSEAVDLRYLVPRGEEWDRVLLARFLRGERPDLPRNLALAIVRRRERRWGLVALRRADDERFVRDDLRDLNRIAETVSRHVRRLDRDRSTDVRAKIDQKVMEQLNPKDLFYEILHGLRSLTRYDHSSSLYLLDDARTGFELVAEQIAWRKARSERIGARLVVDEELLACLTSGDVYGFDRIDDEWREWDDRIPGRIMTIFDGRAADAQGAAAGDAPVPDEAGREGDGGACHEHSVLLAPFAVRGDGLGVVKVAGIHAHTMGVYEAQLVRLFLPKARVAFDTLERATTLEQGVVEAEKKHAMADLARGVSHDVNNALGAVLPLVQQMLADVRERRVDVPTFVADLEQLEQQVLVCRRIFGGMLSFARGAANVLGRGDLRRAVESTRAVLEKSMRRQHIDVAVAIPDGLPAVHAAQGDLEQLILNLATNARDAMPDGGDFTIRVTDRDGELEVVISDTGRGMTREEIARVQEPFYTTKSHGHGLGLSICRSIVWALQGRMTIDSRPGEGTRVTLHLPTADGDET